MYQRILRQWYSLQNTDWYQLDNNKQLHFDDNTMHLMKLLENKVASIIFSKWEMYISHSMDKKIVHSTHSIWLENLRLSVNYY